MAEARAKSFPFEVRGVEVEFPHENPYPAQRAMIPKFLGFENALLESTTGKGKSLVLLAAALSYRKHIGARPIVPPTKRDPFQHHREELADAGSAVSGAARPVGDPHQYNVPLRRSVWYAVNGENNRETEARVKIPMFFGGVVGHLDGTVLQAAHKAHGRVHVRRAEPVA